MNYAVILSGGTGSRLKGIDLPKQYYKINGRMILHYCVKTIESLSCIDGYVIVAAEEWRKEILSEQAAGGIKFLGFADPGENRQTSVLKGLRALQKTAREGDIVLIQDAARPLTSGALIQTCIEAAAGADGAMPVLKMKDTVYYSENGTEITSLLEREKILAGQAPEAFVYGKYLAANERLTREEMLRVNGSSEPALQAGMKIVLTEGDERNFKVTTAEDLERLKKIMEER